MLHANSLPRPDGLLEVESVLDIGAGLRPMAWYKPKHHVCVEPYGPYADELSRSGYLVFRMPALQALQALQGHEVGAVYMLDVIEHMTREQGEHVLALARTLRPQQIVVSTPVGFLHQSHDAWGLGGEYWQTHRSGWHPSDFPGWAISYYPNGHGEGFTAVSPCAS